MSVVAGASKHIVLSLSWLTRHQYGRSALFSDGPNPISSWLRATEMTAS